MNLKKWEFGTKLSTQITEQNANIGQIESHLADYASMPEIITGSDGIAIKFPSGLMICTGSRSYVFEELVVDGVTSFELKFPRPFVARPMSIVDSLRVNDSMRARGYTGNISSTSETGFIYDIALDAGTLRSGGSIYYTAIGFWK